jgi:hypothetical protein
MRPTRLLLVTPPASTPSTALPRTGCQPRYQDAGIGIQIPVQQPPDGRELDLDNRTRNTLQHTTASPSKITE